MKFCDYINESGSDERIPILTKIAQSVNKAFYFLSSHSSSIDGNDKFTFRMTSKFCDFMLSFEMYGNTFVKVSIDSDARRGKENEAVAELDSLSEKLKSTLLKYSNVFSKYKEYSSNIEYSLIRNNRRDIVSLV